MNVERTTVGTMMVDLDDRRAIRDSVGSKAFNLARSVRAGFPVPKAVVLTTEAFETFSGTQQQHQELTAALQAIIERVGDGPLAVRSSGVAEDLASASFAGQYETVLGVRGLAALEEAVRRCWRSAQSDHALAYKAVRGIDDLAMAVIVQKQVPAEAAGVAFSANPVTGSREEVVINAVLGLGDRLVSGEVSAEEWVVRGDRAECVSSPEPAIDQRMAAQIAALARQVEDLFQGPQDIEWAVAGTELYLLQARPITTLPSPPVEPVPIEIVIPDGYWERDVSHMPTPWHPIDELSFPLIQSAMRTWVDEFGYLFDGIEFRDIGGWVYNRLTPIGGKEGPELPTWVMWLGVRLIPVIRRRIAAAREAVRTDKAGQYIQAWYDEWRPELDSSFTGLRDVELSAISDRELADHIETCIQLMGRGMEIHTLLHGSMAMMIFEFVSGCENMLDWDMSKTLSTVSGTSRWSTEPSRHVHELAEMARENPLLLERAERTSEDLIEALRSIDAGFARRFAEYLDEHGHVSLGVSGTLGDETLAEEPSRVLDVIRGHIETGYRPAVADDENAKMRADAIAEAREHLADTPQAAEFERLLERAARAYPVREDNDPYTFFRPIAVTRYALLELGERLATRGVFAQRGDVLFLTLDEALAELDHNTDRRALVTRRKGERLWAEQHPGPPSYGEEKPPPSSLTFLSADARLPMEAILWSLDSIMATRTRPRSEDHAATVAGIPASQGHYRGPVRVIRDESQFEKLRPGDVLVCPITSPPWSIVFPTIGALVTDSGGVLSHPAIIAREYRIPAVVATGNATRLLEDGQVVTIDGTTGTVTAEEAP
jgi:phosphohistidine swiveling domain-containing protein